MICATAIVVMAYWQAQVAVAKETAERQKVMAPPVKTKRAARSPVTAFQGDPATDYIARCEKGMSDKEIMWIIEDFQNAGLAVDLLGEDFFHRTRDELTIRQKEFLDRRAAQFQWYHDALVDGLRLNPAQSSQVSTNLSKSFDLAKAEFYETFNAPLSSYERDAEVEWETIAAQKPMEKLITSYRWLDDEKLQLMPWNLCSLTPAQEKLTWKSWVDKTAEESSAIQQQVMEVIEQQAKVASEQQAKVASEQQAMAASERIHDPLSRILPCPSLGFGELGHAVLLAPVYFQWPNLILPFLNQQKFPSIDDQQEDESVGVFLAKIRALHPAQLKLLLLFEPGYSTGIRRALNGEAPF